MGKKRQISNLAIGERVKICHQRSFPYARVRNVCDKSYRVDRPLCTEQLSKPVDILCHHIMSSYYVIHTE